MTVQLIGITGRAGSGKDTVADILVREHGFRKVALADPMKRFCRDVFGFSEEQLWGPSSARNKVDDRWGVSPRYVLQTLGTEWGRKLVHQDVWVRRCVREFTMSTQPVVVPDVRFQNELDVIHGAGGCVFRVARLDERPVEGGVPGHESENGVAGVDVTLNNFGPLEALPMLVRRALEIVSMKTSCPAGDHPDFRAPTLE